MSLLHESNLDTAEIFLKAIRRSNSQWWPDSETTSPWVFRGVGNAKWELIPSAWRESGNRLKPLIDRIRQQSPEKSDSQLKDWLAAELEAIHQFTLTADRLGFEVRGLAHRWPHYDLVWESGSHPDMLLHPDGALAQHHGIPTRLLDWTENPLAAAYFAAADQFRDENARAIAFWALDSSRIETLEADDWHMSFVVVRIPRFQNQFSRAQSGLFTHLLGAEHFFFDNGRWPSMEELLRVFASGANQSPILRKITLPIEEVPNLLTKLDREGVNKSGLMPTLDNVATAVVRGWMKNAGLKKPSSREAATEGEVGVGGVRNSAATRPATGRR